MSSRADVSLCSPQCMLSLLLGSRILQEDFYYPYWSTNQCSSMGPSPSCVIKATFLTRSPGPSHPDQSIRSWWLLSPCICSYNSSSCVNSRWGLLLLEMSEVKPALCSFPCCRERRFQNWIIWTHWNYPQMEQWVPSQGLFAHKHIEMSPLSHSEAWKEQAKIK